MKMTAKSRKPAASLLTPASVSDLDQFRVDAFVSHNLYREKHGVALLQHCRVLSDFAQYWAEYIAKQNKIIHSTPEWRMQYNNIMLGENIVATNGFPITGKGLSDMWYSESFKYNYDADGETQNDCKSFTQMIWNDSRQVGFGKAEANDGSYYAVALYHPCGNIDGEFKDNVKPVKDESVNNKDQQRKETARQSAKKDVKKDEKKK